MIFAPIPISSGVLHLGEAFDGKGVKERGGARVLDAWHQSETTCRKVGLHRKGSGKPGGFAPDHPALAAAEPRTEYLTYDA